MIHTAQSECVPNLTSPGLGSPTSSPGSLNILKTVFSDFVSLEHPTAESLSSPPSSPLSSSPSPDSLADKPIEKVHTPNAGIDNGDLLLFISSSLFVIVLHIFTLRLHLLNQTQRRFTVRMSRLDFGLLH